MKNTFLKIGILGILLFMISCGPSTVLQRTWKDPSFTADSKPFKKVMVIARIKDETINRTAEDKIVAQMRAGTAIPSYSYLQSKDTIPSLVDSKLKKDGFDGIVIMNLIGVDKSVDVRPGGYGGYYSPYYYGGYYGYNAPYVVENETFVVETKIYSLESGKLLWSGTTATLNPTSLTKTIDDIIAANRAEMVKQGLIHQPEKKK